MSMLIFNEYLTSLNPGGRPRRPTRTGHSTLKTRQPPDLTASLPGPASSGPPDRAGRFPPSSRQNTRNKALVHTKSYHKFLTILRYGRGTPAMSCPVAHEGVLSEGSSARKRIQTACEACRVAKIRCLPSDQSGVCQKYIVPTSFYPPTCVHVTHIRCPIS